MNNPLLRRAAILLLALAIALPACAPAPAPRPTAAPTTAPASLVGRPEPALFLDATWYRAEQVRAADRWNGGLNGRDGMGTYQPDFDGFFRVNLGREWRRKPLGTSSSIAQSRAIYMNVEAYRAAGPEAGQRFLDAVNKGVDALLRAFRDPKLGGFYWHVSPLGDVRDDQKHGYGNVHPLFALAHAYAVTANPAHLQAAREQLAVLEAHFLDPAFPGAVRPGLTADFRVVVGVNNVDTFTHYFEALLALYDVTEGAEREHVAVRLAEAGNFLVEALYVDQEGFVDRGYVAYNYDAQWRPAQEPYSRERQWSGALHATTGHNVELAYLLSRAVERGFDAAWLATAEKLLRFATEYALDPTYGAMRYEVTDYAGQPLAGNPDNDYFIWWAQAETARALLHFAVVRGWDTRAGFKQIEGFFHERLTDQEFGGLYERLKLDPHLGLYPDMLDKGHVWKVNYHSSMFFAEAQRLATTYPAEVAALNAAAPPGP